MNNKVFYQHPNLMRVLGMHETVMEVMVNVLGAEKSQVMLWAGLRQTLTPWAATLGAGVPGVSYSSQGEAGMKEPQEIGSHSCHWSPARACAWLREAQAPTLVPTLTVLLDLLPVLCDLLPALLTSCTACLPSSAAHPPFCTAPPVPYTPAPSTVGFLWFLLGSQVLFVLCQEKAVLKGNEFLMMMLVVFPQECFLCEPSSSNWWGVGEWGGIGHTKTFIPVSWGSYSVK